MAKDKEMDTVMLWLKSGENAPLFYPDRYFPEMAEAREQLWQRLAGEREPAKPEQRTEAGGWQLDRTKDVLRAEFPDGVPPNLTDKEVRRRIEPVFKKNGWKLSSVDTIARARGRRERRD
jgi:hypothetical protein